MGKYMKKNRRASVMEGSLGVKTRASCRKNKSFSSLIDDEGGNLVAKSCCNEEGSSGSAAAPSQNSNFVAQSHAEEEQEENSLPSNFNNEASATSCVQEQQEEHLPEEAPMRNSKRILRESHSDSCLRTKSRREMGSHSRSNSATFTPREIFQEIPKDDAEQEEACCGDNVAVFSGKERSHQSTSCTCEEDVVSVTNPFRVAASSSSTQKNRDCGPAWRHRVSSGCPAADEIEDFFAQVEEDDDKNTRRFSDKYNFDVANDVPLSGRFEWVQIPSSS